LKKKKKTGASAHMKTELRAAPHGGSYLNPKKGKKITFNWTNRDGEVKKAATKPKLRELGEGGAKEEAGR